MAQLFLLHPDDRCEIHELRRPANRLPVECADAILVVPANPGHGADAGSWALIAPVASAARVNGTPVFGGIRLLGHRDEIRVGRTRFFFSTENLACVVAFPGPEPGRGQESVRCPRCTDELKAGDPAVRCPNPDCRTWHHEMPTHQRPCWSYSTSCAVCGGPTTISDEFRWEPTQL